MTVSATDMCGFTGIFDFRGVISPDELKAHVTRMRDTLRHRGPDDAGAWVDPGAHVALGHRRLSIVDLSPAGHQPMHSASGRYVIAFNGEIYNFAELREGFGSSFQFRGHSDTEVLLAAVETWGVRSALQRFNGMFAFALWDRQELCLWLARDRFGEKPLYYGMSQDGVLLFGSELKALRAFPTFAPEVDPASVGLLLDFGYVPAPQTIFHGVRKLPPASLLRIAKAPDVGEEPQRYWSLEELVRTQRAQLFRGTFAEAVEGLDQSLRKAVRSRMVADVPLGAFLSGGIDSSTIVGMMQAQSPRPVKTFSIGFFEQEFNEAEHAKAVARHIGTDHTEYYVTAQEALDVIPRLPELYDEPFADSSQIPTFLVSQLARRDVTVALSGDAGDEVLGGYSRYQGTTHLWRRLRKVPHLLRLGASLAMERAPSGALDRVLRSATHQRVSRERFRAVSPALRARDLDDLYATHMTTPGVSEMLLGGAGRPATIAARLQAVQDLPEIDRMMFVDSVSYLPDDILTKVDRASMAVGLEVRVPILDPDVFAFCWSLPTDMKVRDRQGKAPMRRVLERYVPPKLFERPKTGFGVPVDGWLRDPLKAWAEEALNETRLRQEGLFHAGNVRAGWAEHLSGERNQRRLIWPILMFQAWHEAWRQHR